MITFLIILSSIAFAGLVISLSSQHPHDPFDQS